MKDRINLLAPSKHFSKGCCIKLISIILVFCGTIFMYNNVQAVDEPSDKLTEEEVQKIEEYVGKVTIDDGVGQLIMAGIPGDMINFQDFKVLPIVKTKNTQC